jgi:hypothetical protein
VYQAGTEYFNIASLTEIRVSYGFRVFSNAKLITVVGVGATTVENYLNGQRGFTPFFSIQAGNKAYFEPLIKIFYPNIS